MSALMYIAADVPLVELANPHDRVLSVNEALAVGVEVPEHMLAEGFDRDRPGVILCSDREISINTDTGVIDDGGFDDDLAIVPCEKMFDMYTGKQCCARLEWLRCTEGRAARVIAYLRKVLERAGEVELWHIWMGGEWLPRVTTVEIPVGELVVEDIAELDGLDVALEPVVHYCFLIKA